MAIVDGAKEGIILNPDDEIFVEPVPAIEDRDQSKVQLLMRVDGPAE
jgi:hypothetical protein